MEKRMTIYHGSEEIIEHPVFGAGPAARGARGGPPPHRYRMVAWFAGIRAPRPSPA